MNPCGHSGVAPYHALEPAKNRGIVRCLVCGEPLSQPAASVPDSVTRVDAYVASLGFAALSVHHERVLYVMMRGEQAVWASRMMLGRCWFSIDEIRGLTAASDLFSPAFESIIGAAESLLEDPWGRLATLLGPVELRLVPAGRT